MTQPRFKIDIGGSYHLFGLFVWRRRGWWGGRWVQIDSFSTPALCRELYEKVKDLPEYLE